jgi:hypothetical protein
VNDSQLDAGPAVEVYVTLPAGPGAGPGSALATRRTIRITGGEGDPAEWMRIALDNSPEGDRAGHE